MNETKNLEKTDKKHYIIHNCTREYIYPVERKSLELKIQTSKKTEGRFYITLWNNLRNDIPKRTIEMECYARDNDFDYYSCIITFDEAPRYIRYFITLDNGREKLYLNAYKMDRNEPTEGFFEYHCTNEEDVFQVPDWSKGVVMYQIFPERFCNGDVSNDPDDIENWGDIPTRENYFGGDIKGIINKLDYLNDLGVDAIYLTPIFEATSNHKYDTVDYFKIDESFGTLDDFKKLVSNAHKLNIKVVLDGVFNHCGYYFAPFQDVIEKQEASQYKDWFYVSEFPLETDPPNYECVGYYKWMPKLRHRTKAVRDFILDVCEYWIRETDIDGWRLDVCDEVDFTLWHEVRKRIKGIKSDAIIIGETWTDGRDLMRGDQMDSVMNYLFRDALVSFIAKGQINALEFDRRLGRMLSIYNLQSYNSLYNMLGSHDTDRFYTLCKQDKDRMMLAIAVQMTFPGMPAIYYGDEIGTIGDNDPDCRRCMDWDNQDEEIKNLYKKTISLRRDSAALKVGRFRSIVCSGNVYGYARTDGDETVYVVINNDAKAAKVDLPILCNKQGSFKSLINDSEYDVNEVDDKEFYNDDINKYSGYLELKLDGLGFEIIK